MKFFLLLCVSSALSFAAAQTYVPVNVRRRVLRWTALKLTPLRNSLQTRPMQVTSPAPMQSEFLHNQESIELGLWQALAVARVTTLYRFT